MGGAGLRGVHTERRCAGVVDAAGLASGEMNEDPLDDLGRVDAGDDAQRAATHTTVFDISVSQVARMTTVQSATATGMNRRSRFPDSGSSAPIRERPARASPDRAHPGGRHVECAQTRPTPFTTSPATLGASSRGFPLLIR